MKGREGGHKFGKMGLRHLWMRLIQFTVRLNPLIFSVFEAYHVSVIYIILLNVETVEARALAFLSHFWLQLVWPSLPYTFVATQQKRGSYKN